MSDEYFYLYPTSFSWMKEKIYIKDLEPNSYHIEEDPAGYKVIILHEIYDKDSNKIISNMQCVILTEEMDDS